MARTTKDNIGLFYEKVAAVKKTGGMDAIEKIHASGVVPQM